MNRQRTITAAIFLVVSMAATAETPLTSTEMDGVNAGSSAIADAIASARGHFTGALTTTVTNVRSIGLATGQYGAISEIVSEALADAHSFSNDTAIGLATSFGITQGTALSDTQSFASTATDMEARLSASRSLATNTALARSIILELRAAARSQSLSESRLSNFRSQRPAI